MMLGPALGIDAGTSAIKLVVTDSGNSLSYSVYRPHGGTPGACLKAMLSKAAARFPTARIAMTGSLAHSIAGALTGGKNSLPLFLADTIPAAVNGCRAMAPEAGCIMEIGAARAVFITGISNDNPAQVKFFFNSSCSAGTGSFLEEQARRLNIPLESLSEQTRKATRILPIAGRCSVFSKTDMIHFQQDGAGTPDILLGLIHAMVRNYRANVVKRNPIAGPVFLAGRVMEVHGIIDALSKTFGLDSQAFIFCRDHSYANAFGAALAMPPDTPPMKIPQLCRLLDTGSRTPAAVLTAAPLAPFGTNDSQGRHPCKKNGSPMSGYLGVDVGSTSTNLVLISPEKEVLRLLYLRTRGTPLDTVKSGLDQIRRELGPNFSILAAGVTGSGRSLAGRFLKADLVVNEITAQAEGALFRHPEADTILEIGGQDSKFIRLENQVVTHFEMNRICAAGTGSFLEEQAAKIGVDIRNFGPLALTAQTPLDLGERCTVFIEGALSNALGRREDKADIVAGLAYSIVRNYLTRVVADHPLGNHIFLQGGIAYNQGVVNAFRSLLGRPVTVTPYFSVTGALGAALLTRSGHVSGKSRAPEKGLSQPAGPNTKDRPSVPDIWAESRELFIKDYQPHRFPGRPTIGIPRVLFLHKLFVLFNLFFTRLGFNVLISEPTTREMVDKSRETAMEETCYPVKLVNGHVQDLLEKGVDYIFLPRIFTMKHSDSWSRKDYGCLYFQTAAQLAGYALDLEARGVSLLTPAISFKLGPRYVAKTIIDLGKELGQSRLATILAMQKAALGFMGYNRALHRLGKQYLKALPAGEPVFVIITRPYGINDPVLNMSVPEHLSSMGYHTMPLFVLEPETNGLDRDYPNMYWPFGQHILAGARKIRQTPNLFAVYLTNHGCGPDTALLHLFRKEMAGKPFLHLEVDEHASRVGVITRLEAFVLSFDKKKAAEPETLPPAGLLCEPDKKEPLYIPHLFPYTDLACAVLSEKGFAARVLPPLDADSLAHGRSLGVAKEYLSFISLMGNAKKQAIKGNGRPQTLVIPQTEGAEVEGLYARAISSLLSEEFPETRIFSPFLEDIVTASDFFDRFFLPLMAADIIRSGPVRNLEKNLGHVLTSVSVLTEDAVIDLAAETAGQTADPGKTEALTLLVTGEPAVVFSEFNHQFLLEAVHARILWQPLSEVLYLLWEDWNHRRRDPVVIKHLAWCRKLMVRVAGVLGPCSAFEPDPGLLKPAADSILPMFTGGNGRYRMAKRFTRTAPNGIVEMGSAYENTGIITRQLAETRPAGIPVLSLVFDGSAHNKNAELLRNFIYYLSGAHRQAAKTND